MERAQIVRMAAFGAVVVAVGLWAAGVPLGTILLVGVWLFCPLMMMGMHGHGSHQAHGSEHADEKDRASGSGRRLTG